MKDLGKISIIPKGDYSADATYEMLDLVNHNEASWVCKKDCTGQEPSDSNTEFWQRFGTAVDLSNYFPKSGGTIDGDVTVEKESGQVAFSFKNGNREMVIVVTESGTCGVLDQTNKVWLWNSELNGTTKFYGTASGNVNSVNGTAHMNALGGFVFNRNNGTVCTPKYIGNGSTLGYLGFGGVNEPTMWSADGKTSKALLHTGNKPTGTYTGNGSATNRQIAVGGVSKALMIKRTGSGIVLVDQYSAYGITPSGVVSFTKAELNFTNGVLYMGTANEIVNVSGGDYDYYSL